MRYIVIDIAKICHEVNRAYCRSIGDDSQKPWDDADQWQKDSAVKGVRFALDNDSTPERQHLEWSKEKMEQGWAYGTKKDPELKTHPCLLPYEALPEEQKTKDALFVAVVNCFKE